MTADRAAWLAERKLGIGGSDAASLLNIGWGCRRRLWYDKRDTPADYPREETKAMTLGKLLEPWFAEQYAEVTGRKVYELENAWTHPEIPELRVNVDRSVFDQSRSHYGILEIKSVGRAAFYKYKREGLPVDYIAQVQHGLAVGKQDYQWGSYCIGSRDSGEILWWDVEPNETIIREIESEGPLFWRMVENGPAPDRLEPDDKRCSNCEYRKACQGDALIHVDDGEMPQAEELRGLLAEYMERKALFAQAEELVEETGEELRTKLGDRQAVYVGDKKVYYRPQAGRTLYKGKELLEAYKKTRSALDGLLKELANVDFILTPKQIEDIKAGIAFSNEHAPPEQFVDTSKPSRPLRIF